jgi:hypothetical protein
LKRFPFLFVVVRVTHILRDYAAGRMATASLPPVDSAMIKRTVLGATAVAVLKGTIWGNAIALSQAAGACRV